MSQYIQQNSHRYYPPAYDCQSVPNSHLSQHSQRNSIVIRESSMNRNNSICGSMVFKQGKILESIGGKIKRQSSVRNGVEFKQNDPLTKSSLFSNSNVNRVGIINLRDSMDFVSQYDSKGSYSNQMVVKRDKSQHGTSRQNVILQKSNLINEKNSESKINHDKEFEVLSERLGRLEVMVRESCEVVGVCDKRMSKLERMVFDLQNKNQTQEENQQNISNTQPQPTSSKQSATKPLSHRHSRSISNLPTSTPSFKQLSQIMNLIQQSKKYQIKNSQQYRKMIEQFRMTLLEFRGELNETVKRSDIEGEMGKLKELILVGISSSSNGKNNNCCPTPLSPKSSLIQLSSTANNSPSLSSSQHQSQITQKMNSEILSLKLAIQKLQDNAISLKADMVKCNVREMKFGQEVNEGLAEVVKRVNYLQKEWVPFDVKRRGKKCEGGVVCFKVSQEMTVLPAIPKPPLLSRSTHMSTSSLDQPQLQAPLATSSQLRHQPLSHSSSLSSTQPLTIYTKTYYIDSSGYLLDKDNFYLLNDKNEQIHLSQRQIMALRKLKVLE